VAQRKPISIDDAIEMQRIQRSAVQNEELAYFAPDGTRFVAVIWKGDLERNVNLYSLTLFDFRASPVTQRALVTAEFISDKTWRLQHFAPISQISFLPDNRTVVFLGSLRGEDPQVFAIDVDTRELRQLTHHSTAIRSFGVSPGGQVRVFSAVARPDGTECRGLYRAGVSFFDRRLETDDTIPSLVRLPGRGTEIVDALMALDLVTEQRCTSRGLSFRPIRDYFLVPESGSAEPLLDRTSARVRISDASLFLRQDLVISPTGTHAILVPWQAADPTLATRYQYLREREAAGNATSIALIDLRTKQVRALSAAPAQVSLQGRILWSSDGASVITRSLLPLDGDNEAENERRARLPPVLVDIDIRTGRVVPIELPTNAEPVSIDPTDRLIVREGRRLLALQKRGGQWSRPTLLVNLDDTGFNPRQRVSTNGSVVIGVRDALSTPPEIAAYTPGTGTTVLTDLNPTLRTRAFGAVEKVFWQGSYDSASFGYLIKPVDFVEGRRYPLVILFKDEGVADSSDDSFLIDGQDQLSGHAAQPLAGHGFVVLFTPGPPSITSIRQTVDEGPHIVAHIESGIDYLDQRGLIDRTRVALAGWSRSGFWADYVLTHSRHLFKAGVSIDGGGNYEGFMDQICGPGMESTDACRRNVDRMDAPRLSQQHSAASMLSEMSLITKLRNLGKAVDLYFYPDEAHNLRGPGRRRHSLTLNVDWYRFWLQDYEDPNPEKRVQYERWRELRKLQAR
jgi:dipeptidyl aminopeptidase/acylaminoacyl peptidase